MVDILIKSDWKKFPENVLIDGKVHLMRCPRCWSENLVVAAEQGICISCRYSAYEFDWKLKENPSEPTV
jgi:hypothetical protein